MREVAFATSSEFVRTRADELRINEIFFSLQGESSRIGLPTVFVRLTGCPLRCGYCDTAYAFHEGKTVRIDDVLAEVATHGAKYVCVTGGEPLAQKSCITLLTRLCDAGYSVSLETSGALDVSAVDPRVSRVVDVKTPGSGEVEKNQWANLAQLRQSDELKFVLTSEEDYQWAKAVIFDRRLDAICPILLSPAFAEVKPSKLAEWVLRDKLKVRMQVQLHKVIWGERRGV
ncbi:MAG: 7-carboxy-7-deazaguanine synthase QueE [Rhodocyclaceae bacterium]|nr:7-carboxy-7-deazaguanine synthase QueE [Rhodocyclaceae bacterium]